MHMHRFIEPFQFWVGFLPRVSSVLFMPHFMFSSGSGGFSSSSAEVRTFLGNFLPGVRGVHEGRVLDLIVDVFILVEGKRPAEAAE